MRIEIIKMMMMSTIVIMYMRIRIEMIMSKTQTFPTMVLARWGSILMTPLFAMSKPSTS